MRHGLESISPETHVQWRWLGSGRECPHEGPLPSCANCSCARSLTRQAFQIDAAPSLGVAYMVPRSDWQAGAVMGSVSRRPD